MATTRENAAQRTKFGRELERGLKTVLAHTEGRISLPTRHVEVPETIDVKAVRAGLRMSQSKAIATVHRNQTSASFGP